MANGSIDNKLVRICNRSDTSTNWSTNNPILKDGEIGYDSTNNIIKVGNGTNKWNDLVSISGNSISSESYDDTELKNMITTINNSLTTEINQRKSEDDKLQNIINTLDDRIFKCENKDNVILLNENLYEYTEFPTEWNIVDPTNYQLHFTESTGSMRNYGNYGLYFIYSVLPEYDSSTNTYNHAVATIKFPGYDEIKLSSYGYGFTQPPQNRRYGDTSYYYNTITIDGVELHFGFQYSHTSDNISDNGMHVFYVSINNIQNEFYDENLNLLLGHTPTLLDVTGTINDIISNMDISIDISREEYDESAH